MKSPPSSPNGLPFFRLPLSPQKPSSNLHAFFYTVVGSLLTLVLTVFSLSHLPSATFVPSRTHAPLAKIANESQFLKYLPQEKILVLVMPKGGTTSLWTFLYRGLFGHDYDCDSYVQTLVPKCWHGRVRDLKKFPPSVRVQVLTSPDVLRVAVWRDPFERLISSFKSKFACAATMYRTDFHDRNRMVPQLLEHANLTSDVPCFNISSFADTLDVIRQRIEDGVFDVELLNPHIRPERMYFDHIRWGLVLKTADLSDAEKVRPIVERLPYRKFVKNGASHLHESTGPEIVMPASTAKKLADFAALTRERPRRR